METKIQQLMIQKIHRIQQIISRTISSLNAKREQEFIGNSDVMVCTSSLVESSHVLDKLLIDIQDGLPTEERNNKQIQDLQKIQDQLSMIISGYGTETVEDLIYVVFGGGELLPHHQHPKSQLIATYVKPMGFKRVSSAKTLPGGERQPVAKTLPGGERQPVAKTLPGGERQPVAKTHATSLVEEERQPLTKTGEDMVDIETAPCWECFDWKGHPGSSASLIMQVRGIRFTVVFPRTNQRIIVHGIVDDVVTDCLFVGQSWIEQRKRDILQHTIHHMALDEELMQRITECMTIKDFLVSSDEDMGRQALAIQNDVDYINQTNLADILKRFTSSDLLSQRQLLMSLLIHSGPIVFSSSSSSSSSSSRSEVMGKESCVPNIAYILYDLMSSATVSTSQCLMEQQQQQPPIVLNPFSKKMPHTVTSSSSSSSSSVTKYDTKDQELLFSTFPWKVRRYFKHAMDYTMQYTNEMINRYDVSRVSLEQQVYVMKAPESVREKAMLKLKEIRGKADDSGAKAKQYLEGLLRMPFGIVLKEDILQRASQLRELYKSIMPKNSNPNLSVMHIQQAQSIIIDDMWETCRREWLPSLSTKEVADLYKKLINGGKQRTKTERIREINEFLEGVNKKNGNGNNNDNNDNSNTQSTMMAILQRMQYRPHIVQTCLSMQSLWQTMQREIQQVRSILDASIYGHDHAKKQILKIVGQWMTGEQSGYCFGFEGAPGVGKTSLAKKGLSQCLYNEATKTSRPFVFIALGGTCNGSTLEGHSYTYVNSTWGRIVDALMDAKCMNPIIYIDELDKVSKTEHGKEIIGILMHLIDTTQNTGFQDKYFSGIDIDLSKALFIFSYNDASQIDSILLDRIHRIRFDALTVEDKKVIIRQYIVPEIERKMGMQGCVLLTEEIMEYLIETYTSESGVRKLKEVLFDLYGEINIRVLDPVSSSSSPTSSSLLSPQVKLQEVALPIVITQDEIENIYLKKYNPIRHKKIASPLSSSVGMIHGLWANGLGNGGIIPIQASFFPTTTFLELKLTGQQGDVMKESMNVAKTLAWGMLSSDKQKEWIATFEATKCQGIHIHCPDGATPKDGPSAGAAITLALYSLFLKKPIRNDVAITGEINLQGEITEIGGLEQKILGGIRAGIRHFLFPDQNVTDFKKYIEKYGEKIETHNVEFTSVSYFDETIRHVFLSSS